MIRLDCSSPSRPSPYLVAVFNSTRIAFHFRGWLAVNIASSLYHCVSVKYFDFRNAGIVCSVGYRLGTTFRTIGYFTEFAQAEIFLRFLREYWPSTKFFLRHGLQAPDMDKE